MSLSQEQLMQFLQGMSQIIAQAVAAQVQLTMRSNDVSIETSKPRCFDGSDAAWLQWSWCMEAAATHLGMEDVLQMAGTQRPESVEGMSSMDEHITNVPRSCMAFLWRAAHGKQQQS